MPQQPSELVRKQITKQLGEDVIIQSDQLTEKEVMTGAPLTYMAYKDLGDGNIETLERFKYDPQAIQVQQVKEKEAKQKAKVDAVLKEREEVEKRNAFKKAQKDKAIALQKSYAKNVKASQDKPLAQSFKEELGL